MLSDFTWNMTGYIPKHQVNPHGDGIIPYVAERIFQLEPEPRLASSTFRASAQQTSTNTRVLRPTTRIATAA